MLNHAKLSGVTCFYGAPFHQMFHNNMIQKNMSDSPLVYRGRLSINYFISERFKTAVCVLSSDVKSARTVS